jgi:hypothetical protein
VADLPADTTEANLKDLFKDVSHCSLIVDHYSLKLHRIMQCGNVREIKTIQLPTALVATVEFFDRVSLFQADHLFPPMN